MSRQLIVAYLRTQSVLPNGITLRCIPHGTTLRLSGLPERHSILQQNLIGYLRMLRMDDFNRQSLHFLVVFATSSRVIRCSWRYSKTKPHAKYERSTQPEIMTRFSRFVTSSRVNLYLSKENATRLDVSMNDMEGVQCSCRYSQTSLNQSFRYGRCLTQPEIMTRV